MKVLRRRKEDQFIPYLKVIEDEDQEVKLQWTWKYRKEAEVASVFLSAAT